MLHLAEQSCVSVTCPVCFMPRFRTVWRKISRGCFFFVLYSLHDARQLAGLWAISKADSCSESRVGVTSELAWFCARTRPKHEHIAAADLNRNLGLEVFQ